ncbi:M23 family metallopeptidase [Streptomyces sulphureus]|uniref:M23 family metallopeptidase n=1 Tax=Streptomyces sulphureus TaxID=47758 RepID=UPI0003A8913E|nr:M23 family metallopeptidase [Streptomyces sulphureus]
MTYTATAPKQRPARTRIRWALCGALASAVVATGGTAAAADGPGRGGDDQSAAVSAARDLVRGVTEDAWGNRQRTPTSGWTSPLASSATISQAYGVKGDWAAGHHTGVDFAVPVGTPVRSVGSGTVVEAGSAGDYGNAVTIRMTDGKYTLFAHLSAITVSPGESVQAGKVIGRSGNTGNSTGPHLHFEVREGRAYGTDTDPLEYLASHGVNLP